MDTSMPGDTPFVGAATRPGAVVRGVVWLVFALLVLRFAAFWANAFVATTFPVPGSIALTVLFSTFALLHAASLLGWRAALAFLGICAVVTWGFEQVGIVTGAIYGAYHYGDQLGPKLGAVPVVIPFAWFMMVYASWIVARLLLQGAGDATGRAGLARRVAIAAMAMSAWDTVMDPGMAMSGAWTWEGGGAYFGVPLQNYAGWLMTTLTVYAIAEAVMRRMRGGRPAGGHGLYAALPALIYGLMALDRLLLPDLPELRIVAAFGMGFIALLAAVRITPSMRLDQL